MLVPLLAYKALVFFVESQALSLVVTEILMAGAEDKAGGCNLYQSVPAMRAPVFQQQMNALSVTAITHVAVVFAYGRQRYLPLQINALIEPVSTSAAPATTFQLIASHSR